MLVLLPTDYSPGELTRKEVPLNSTQIRIQNICRQAKNNKMLLTAKKSFIVTPLVIPAFPLPHLRRELENQVPVHKSIISSIKRNYDLDGGKIS